MDKLQKYNELKLTDTEVKALEKFENGRDPYPIALETSLGMYELYLNGYTCEQIQKLNSNFSLGAVVDARVRFEWDKRKEQHLTLLFDNIILKAKTAQASAISFVADQIQVANKLHGERLKKYLQTGNEKDLGDEFVIRTPTAYENAIRLLKSLTGQDEKPSGKQQPATQVNIVTQAAQVSTEKPRVQADDIHRLLEMVEAEVKEVENE